MKSPSIRLASEEDLPELYAAACEALTLDAFSAQLLAEKLFPREWLPGVSSSVYVAEQRDNIAGFMQSVTRPQARKAWVGLFAVAGGQRRRGIGGALLDAIRKAWPPETVDAEVLAIPGNYFTPGLDPRYTEALCFLQRSGFERFNDCVNLMADLSETLRDGGGGAASGGGGGRDSPGACR